MEYKHPWTENTCFTTAQAAAEEHLRDSYRARKILMGPEEADTTDRSLEEAAGTVKSRAEDAEAKVQAFDGRAEFSAKYYPLTCAGLGISEGSSLGDVDDIREALGLDDRSTAEPGDVLEAIKASKTWMSDVDRYAADYYWELCARLGFGRKGSLQQVHDLREALGLLGDAAAGGSEGDVLRAAERLKAEADASDFGLLMEVRGILGVPEGSSVTAEAKRVVDDRDGWRTHALKRREELAELRDQREAVDGANERLGAEVERLKNTVQRLHETIRKTRHAIGAHPGENTVDAGARVGEELTEVKNTCKDAGLWATQYRDALAALAAVTAERNQWRTIAIEATD
jgi:hypothetical protein